MFTRTWKRHCSALGIRRLTGGRFKVHPLLIPTRNVALQHVHGTPLGGGEKHPDGLDVTMERKHNNKKTHTHTHSNYTI